MVSGSLSFQRKSGLPNPLKGLLMPPVRFRIRTIMVVIASLALMMGLLPLSELFCVIVSIAVLFAPP